MTIADPVPASDDTAAATSEDPRDAVTTLQTTQPEAGPAAAPASAPLVPMPVPSGQATQAVGRRKEAVVRVRLVPGTGVFTLNGITLEQYFPNKVHQQLIRDPLVTVNRPSPMTYSVTFPVAVRLARPARCGWLSPAR